MGGQSDDPGATIPVQDALRFLGDARIVPVALDIGGPPASMGVAGGGGGAVAGYGNVRRIFTEKQRLAMLSRDQGCAFPGCTAPPAWTEAHHITAFATEQRTCVDDGCLPVGVPPPTKA